MKSVNLGFAAALLVLLVSFAAQAQSPVAPTSPAASMASADAAVAAADQALARANTAYKAGVGSEMDLQNAQVTLEQANVQAALAHQDMTGIAKSLQKIIDGRQAQIDQAQRLYAAGVVDQNAMIDAQAALVAAKLRSDLYSMLTLEQEKLANTQRLFQVGAAPQTDLEKAQADLKKAQDAFAAAQP